MAANVNSAYMLWRQFAGEAKVPRAAGLGSLRTTQVAADRTVGPTLGDQVESFARAATGAFQASTELDKSQQKLSNDKAQAWMARHTMAEWRDMIERNKVPFQDDPVAMDILHNNTAYGLSLRVEEEFQNKVKSGSFKTVEEADAARVQALEAARSEYSLSAGISPDNKAFRTGFDRDADKRRSLMVALQTDVTDKALRTQARVQTTANITATLTPEFVKNAPADLQVNYLKNSFTQSLENGQFNKDDMPQVLNDTLTNLKGLNGGAKVIKALGDTEFTLAGVTAPLRTHMGGGAFDQYVIAATETEFRQSAEANTKLQETISRFVSTGDSASLKSLINDKSVESGGVETGEIKQLRHAVLAADRITEQRNAQAMQDLQSKYEKQTRITQGVNTLRQYVNGEIAVMSPNAVDRGAKDAKEGREQEQFLLESYTDPQEKLKVSMKLAGLDPRGYAGDSLKVLGNNSKVAWDDYTSRLAAGEKDVKLPPQVAQMQTLYKQDPLLFGAVFKDQPYLDVLRNAESMGSSVEDVARSTAAWKRLPEATRKEAQKSLAVQVQKLGGENVSYAGKAVELLAGTFLSSGVAPEDAVKKAREAFDAQHDRIGANYPVHKGFFSFDGRKESYDSGRAMFDKILPDLYKEVGALNEKSGAVIYDPQSNSVRVQDLDTGAMSQVITSGTLRDRYLAESAKATAAQTMAQEKVIAGRIEKQNANANAAAQNEATKAARAITGGSAPSNYGPDRVKENPLGIRSSADLQIGKQGPQGPGVFPGSRNN